MPYFFIIFLLFLPVHRCFFAWTSTGDGHEEQPFVTDKKENDLSGYERNLYLYHVSKTINFVDYFSLSIRFKGGYRFCRLFRTSDYSKSDNASSVQKKKENDSCIKYK